MNPKPCGIPSPGFWDRDEPMSNSASIRDSMMCLPSSEATGYMASLSPQAEAVALPDFGKNSYPSHTGRVSHTFDEVSQQGFDVIETPEHAGKTQKRERGFAAFGRSVKAADRFRGVGDHRMLAQVAVLLEHAQMFEAA